MKKKDLSDLAKESRLPIIGKSKQSISEDVLPEEGFPQKGEYKVVQFRDQDSGVPYLRLGRKNSTHNEINMDFEQEYMIAGEKPNEFDQYSFDVEGAGKCYVDSAIKTARFYGESIGFEISNNADHLKEINEIYSDWTFVKQE